MSPAASLFVALAVAPGTEAVGLTFFEGVTDNKVASILLAEEVSFISPLFPEGIIGKEAVTSFLGRVAPDLTLDLHQTYLSETGFCAELDAVTTSGIETKEAICLDIQEGEIMSIRLYFDPRPYLED